MEMIYLSYFLPVDWLVLKNFQEVLQKVYFDGGLITLGKACGYQPNLIVTNFKVHISSQLRHGNCFPEIIFL